MARLRNYNHFEGNIHRDEINISHAIMIGLYLKDNFYKRFKKHNGVLKPIEAVQVNGFTFIIDGRHRARANFDNGRLMVPAKVKVSNSENLEDHLFGISHYFIHEIPIIDKNLLKRGEVVNMRIKKDLRKFSDKKKTKIYQRFFKTREGKYE